jgi:putative ABC transport system ATP-binding protein
MSVVVTGPEPVLAAVRPPLIELAGVEKAYRTGKVQYRALRGIDLAIENGDMVAIVRSGAAGASAAALSARPREYERRVVGFFDRAL